MPSPFPGMDPFLEHPEVFPDLHDTLIALMTMAIQPQLPHPYYAAIGARIWVEKSERPLGPDVRIHKDAPGKSARNSGATALMVQERRTEPVVIRIPLDENKETFLQVFKGTLANKRLITSIEILSPTNKTRGKKGRKLYVRKQRQMLKSGVNLNSSPRGRQ